MFFVRWLVKIAYAPLFFAGFIWAAVTVTNSGGGKWVFGVLLLSAIGVSFAAERIAPYEKIWNDSKDDRIRDVLHAVINELSIVLFVAAMPLIAAFIPDYGLWPGDWSIWAQLGLAIIVADFGITIAHYLSHKIEPLWRLHAVHHSVERMYGFNGLLKHPLHQTIELIAGTTPLVLMGMPQEVAILVAFAVAIQLLLQHSNVDMRIGPLTCLWAVASGHRYHHIASKTEGDVNFGLFTMIWDHFLGTFVAGRTPPRDGDLGVAGAPDYPVGYWRQFWAPFRAW